MIVNSGYKGTWFTIWKSIKLNELSLQETTLIERGEGNVGWARSCSTYINFGGEVEGCLREDRLCRGSGCVLINDEKGGSGGSTVGCGGGKEGMMMLLVVVVDVVVVAVVIIVIVSCCY